MDSPGAAWARADTMRALSAVVQAEEQWIVVTEVARRMREDSERARTENRKSETDLQLYVRSLTPSVDAERRRVQRQELLRALSDPPPGEIMSGHALNVLLADLAARASDEGLSG